MAPSQLDLDAVGATDADGAPEPVDPVTRLTKVRVLTFAAAGPLVTGYAAVAALLALVTAIAPLAHFSTAGVLGAALPSWLAAHQVPVAMGGFEFGVLPLLPTVVVMFLAARAAGGAADRLGLHAPREAGQVVGAIAAAHGACGLAVALFYTGRFVDVDPLAAFYYPALVAALAATAGVVRRCGLTGALAARTDDVAVRGLSAGAVAVALLLTAGAAVFTFALLTSITTARELFATFAPGVGNGLGMLLLSLGYLPNAVIAATAFIAGPGFAMGTTSVAPLEFSGGQVPGMPLLAALPEEQASWWPVLCLLPLAVGVMVGRRLRYVAEDPVTRMRGVAVAAGVVALAFVLLAGSAGGRLGVGAFDPVSMRAAAVSVALVLWVGIPAAAVAWFGGPRPAHDTTPGLIPDDVIEDHDDHDGHDEDDDQHDDDHDEDPGAEPPGADSPDSGEEPDARKGLAGKPAGPAEPITLPAPAEPAEAAPTAREMAKEPAGETELARAEQASTIKVTRAEPGGETEPVVPRS